MGGRRPSVLLLAFAVAAAGCQPDTEPMSSSAWVSQTQTLAGEVGTWTPTAPALFRSNAVALIESTGEVMATEGFLVQRYNPYTNTWRQTNAPCIPGMCNIMSLTPLSTGKIVTRYIAPGRMGGTPGWLLHDPGSDTWAAMPGPLSVYRGETVTPLSTGRLLSTGGYVIEGSSSFTTVNSVSLYDSTTNAWTAQPPMSTPREGHTATLLYSGQILVVGGSARS